MNAAKHRAKTRIQYERVTIGGLLSRRRLAGGVYIAVKATRGRTTRISDNGSRKRR
jgi:hypothetical protein